mmetsp:Transcript_242/g.363  ORF Transcript_242/g.363 Transcript_242/m.363 type:complete len:419 (+) Transcript_242:117-1373(+)
MSSELFGILAALAAPLVMTVGFFVWDNNWAGSTFSLNLFKCNLASIGFLVLSIVTRLQDSPFHSFTIESVGFLMLSSVIGILIGDFLWLEGLRLLGARRVIVVDSCKPFLAALLGWIFFGEPLRWQALVGIIVTVAGVFMVIWDGTSVDASDHEQEESEIRNNSEEREECVVTTIEGAVEDYSASAKMDSSVSLPDSNPSQEHQAGSNQCNSAMELVGSDDDDDDDDTRRETIEQPKTGSLREIRQHTASSLRKGYIMSLLNVILDTYGSVLTKQYGSEMNTWEISLVRFGFAGVVMLLISVVMITRDRCIERNNKIPANEREKVLNWYALPQNMTRRAWGKVVIGVSLVTFFTPALSNYALFQIALALTLTLSSVGPLYALPLSWLLQKEKPTANSCIGAMLAVVGVIILSFFGRLE